MSNEYFANQSSDVRDIKSALHTLAIDKGKTLQVPVNADILKKTTT